MREGFFTSHVRRMRQRYQEARDFIVGDLRTYLTPYATVELPAGGMRVLARLKDGLDDCHVAEEALKHDVVVRPLSPLYIDAPPVHGLDIGFTGFGNAEMRRAAVRLGEALRIVAERSDKRAEAGLIATR
jgi:GntR family transcriptional regulator/MocR family aminotransferase